MNLGMKLILNLAVAHFVGWFLTCLILFIYFTDVLYFYVVIGACVVYAIYYISVFKKKYLLPAGLGILLAFLLTYYVV